MYKNPCILHKENKRKIKAKKKGDYIELNQSCIDKFCIMGFCFHLWILMEAHLLIGRTFNTQTDRLRVLNMTYSHFPFPSQIQVENSTQSFIDSQ